MHILTQTLKFLNILEECKNYKVKHLVYASTSSVYGANTNLPHKELNKVDHPLSLYAATKRSNELMAHCYSHLFNLPTTGLRFLPSMDHMVDRIWHFSYLLMLFTKIKK